MLRYRKKAIYSISKLLVTAIIFISGCERDTPVENIDDGIPPAAPRGLNVFFDYDGEIGIEWNQNLEKDVEFYKIFRSKIADSGYTVIDSTSSLYYIDTGLEYDTTYYYKITAVDQFNRESDFSDSVYGTPENIYRPFHPYYITINARNWDDSVTVKLTFSPSYSTDVKHYEIHRSTIDGFTPDSITLIGITEKLSFIDREFLELLKTYYYKIIAVDKGGLKSTPSTQLNDLLLDKPVPVFPQNNTETNYFAEFKIQTCSLPADYKIVIQSNEVYGTETELNFSSELTNSVINVPIKNVTFAAYTDYYWRVFTYTKSNNVPNSYSDLYKFTIIPSE